MKVRSYERGVILRRGGLERDAFRVPRPPTASDDMTARQLRAVLGNDVRYAIDLESATESASLGARWTCGCRAHGNSFARLYLEPCDRHRGAVWAIR